MPDSTSLLAFVAAALVVLLIPGPGVMYVLARSLSQGQRAGLVSVLGLSAGAFVHVIAATVGTAAAVAVTGLIGFVGIIVPHAIRMLTGATYRALLPLSVVCGAGFLVLADVVARTAVAPAEIPIGVVTAFIGAPFFALVLRTTRMGSG